MKRTIVCMLLWVGMAFAIPAMSAVSGGQTGQWECYLTKQGDSLWKLAGEKLNDPRLWENFFKDNPSLKDKGRIIRKSPNEVIVKLYPPECLNVRALMAQGVVPTMIPYDDFVKNIPARVEEKTPNWMWWLIIALAIFAMAMIIKFFIDRMLGKNPVTSGPAVVPGGVTAETAPAAFQATSARQYPGRNVRIARVTRGKMWGVLETEYANGRSVPRRFNGEHGYRAEVSIDGGPEEQMYMAEGCGNPLRYGGALRFITGEGFRFEADEVAQATPAPAPAPAVAIPAVPAPVEAQATPAAPVVEVASSSVQEEPEVMVHYAAPDGVKQKRHVIELRSTHGFQFFSFTDGKAGPKVRFELKSEPVAMANPA